MATIREQLEAKYGKTNTGVLSVRQQLEQKYNTPPVGVLDSGVSSLPVIKQLNQFGIGLGSEIGKAGLGLGQVFLKGANLVSRGMGLGSQYDPLIKNIDTIKNEVYDKSFQKELNSSFGQTGKIIGGLAPYVETAGIVNPATANLSTIPKILARTAPDIGINLAQTGGNLKSAGVTGATSAVANSLFPGGSKVVATGMDLLKNIGKSATSGYVGDVATGLAGIRGEDRTGAKAFIPGLGTVLGTTLGVVSGGKEYFSKEAKNARLDMLKEDIKKETEKLLNKTKGIISKNQLGTKKNTNYQEIISDPVVFKGLKVENGRINPDESINVIDKRIDDVMEAKNKLLPYADKYVTETPKETLRARAYADIEGKYFPTQEEALKNAIDVQLNSLPDSFNASALDDVRAKARAESINAQGLPKDNQFTAIYKAARDLVFEATDNLPVSTNNEFGRANTYVKDMLNTREFLDRTIRGQTVIGGKLNKLGGRIIGASAGASLGPTFGPIGAIVGQEIGAQIADIITNNQLGSAIKMRLIKDLTDNIEVLNQVEDILSKMGTYQPPMLPGQTTREAIINPLPRIVRVSNEIIPMTNKKIVPQGTEIVPRNQRLPVIESNAIPNNTANTTIAINPISSTIPRIFPKGNVIRGTKGMTAEDIQKTHPNIKLTKDVPAKDVYGNSIKIPEGEKLTPYEMKDGKILLQDGQTYLVSKNQFQNIKGNTVGGEAKPFAPELNNLEQTVKGASKWQGNSLMDNGKEIATLSKNSDGTYSFTSDFSEGSDTFKTKVEAMKQAEMDTLGIYSETGTKYSSYQLPEGKNYKEILIKAPKGAEPTAKWIVKDKTTGNTVKEFAYNDEKSARDLFLKNPNKYEMKTTSISPDMKEVTGDFKSSHWEEPNVISHLRLNERTYNGKKVTFMEELQSDWAREARAGKTTATNDNLKNWQELSVKRALQEAVANKSDYFAWINGDQTSARYNLATKVDNVNWGKSLNNDGTKSIKIMPIGNKDLVFVSIDKNGVIQKPYESSNMPSDWKGKKLDEVLGKGLADKIMEKESGTLSGEGLKFGGEWANNLYDKQVGNIVKDLTGAKIETLDMGLPISKDAKTLRLGDDAFKELKKTDIEFGQTFNKGIRDSEYFITKDLGSGKFEGIKKEKLESLIEDAGYAYEKDLPLNSYPNVWEGNTETFDISQKTTTQQGIKLTPEIKAKIQGKALTIKTSGKMYLPKAK